MSPARTATVPTVIRLRCPVGSDASFVLFGLTYRPDAPAATRRAQRCAAHVSVLVDPADLATVLVRDPTDGAFVVASCRTAYARHLSLTTHLERRRSQAAQGRDGHRVQDPEIPPRGVDVGPTLPPPEASSGASPQP